MKHKNAIRLHSARKPFSSFFNLKIPWQKGTSENTLNIHVPDLGHARRVLLILTLAPGKAARWHWADHCKEPSVLGESSRCPDMAVSPSLDRCAARCRPWRQAEGQGLPGTAPPLPHRPQGTGWVSHGWCCQLHTKVAYSQFIVLSDNTQLMALLPLPCGFCPLP